MQRLLIILGAAGLLAGCLTSPPEIRYYTVDMTPSNAARAEAAIYVDRLRVSQALARNEILIKTSPTEVEYYAAAQWAAGLDELVTQKLQSEFGVKATGQYDVEVTGEILAFEQVDMTSGAEAHAKLLLTLEHLDSSKTLEKVYEARMAAGVDGAALQTVGGVVEALSRCLEKVAAEIAADAKNL